MSFSDQLRSERQRLNLSQSEAAALIPHLSHRLLQEWEAGRKTPPVWAQALMLAALANAKPRKKTGHFGRPGNPNF